MTKCKIQGQVTTLQMPFSYNRKSINFSGTHVPICVKDTTPLPVKCKYVFIRNRFALGNASQVEAH